MTNNKECRHNLIKWNGQSPYSGCLECFTVISMRHLKGVYTGDKLNNWTRQPDNKICGIEATHIEYDGYADSEAMK